MVLGARLSWGWDSSRPRDCSRCVPAAGQHRLELQPGPGTDQAPQGTLHWEQPQSGLMSAGGSGEFPGERAVPGACQLPELHCTAEQYPPQRIPSVTKLLPSLSNRTCKSKSHPLRASCSFFISFAAFLRMTTSLKQRLLNH